MAKTQKQKRSPVDLYIAGFPEETRAQLETIRSIIRKAAPKAEERISYAMPAYRMHGYLVAFGGFKNHVGFFPGSEPVVEFKNDLKNFKTSKGGIQFPLEKKIPTGIVTKIVKFRIKKDAAKAKTTAYRGKNKSQK